MSDRDDLLRDRDDLLRDRDEAARDRDELARDREEKIQAGAGTLVRDRRVQGNLFTIQIILNIVVLGLLVGMMIVVMVRVSDFNARQIETVRVQNELQLCAQHDIVTAVKGIGRKLGLPTDDIIPPNVEGLHCATP